MLPIHDHQIISYVVNLKKRIIEFQTQSESGKQVRVIFTDVLAHQFENQVPGSIILDIEQRNITHFYNDNMEVLEATKDYGWPISYSDRAELEKILVDENVNYYIISASYGLHGWVVAKQLDVYFDEAKDS